MTLQQLLALLAVYESGSIRAAATRLNQTQAAVTKTIKNLEEEMNTELLIRESRGVRSTKDGETLLMHGRRACRELEIARETINMNHGNSVGKVNMAVTPVVMMSCLTDTLQTFRAYYPRVNLHIEDGTLMNALPLLQQGLIDFAIVIGFPKGRAMKDFDVELLGDIDTRIVVRKGHELLNDYERASDIEELRKFEWVITADKYHDVTDRFNRLLGVEPPEKVTLCTAQVVGAIVECSNAIAPIPRALLSNPEFDNLVELPTAVRLGRHTLELVTPAGRPMTPAIEFLIHCLREQTRSLFAITSEE